MGILVFLQFALTTAQQYNPNDAIDVNELLTTSLTFLINVIN